MLAALPPSGSSSLFPSPIGLVRLFALRSFFGFPLPIFSSCTLLLLWHLRQVCFVRSQYRHLPLFSRYAPTYFRRLIHVVYFCAVCLPPLALLLAFDGSESASGLCAWRFHFTRISPLFPPARGGERDFWLALSGCPFPDVLLIITILGLYTARHRWLCFCPLTATRAPLAAFIANNLFWRCVAAYWLHLGLLRKGPRLLSQLV